mgnify:CR=1 FL=1
MSKRAANKTQPTRRSVAAYIKSLDDASRQAEATRLLAIFKDVTKTEPVLWDSIIGFGSYHYTYDSGREGDSLATGFAMRQSGLTIYIMPGYHDYSDILEKLGPHKLGKSCLYLKHLDDVHERVLKQLIRAGLRDLKKRYPVTL